MKQQLINSGYLWTGHGWAGEGLSKYDLQNGELLDKYTTEDGLPHNNVWAIFPMEQGQMYIGTESGLSLFEDGQFKNLTEQHNLEQTPIFEILATGVQYVLVCRRQWRVSAYTTINGHIIRVKACLSKCATAPGILT